MMDAIKPNPDKILLLTTVFITGASVLVIELMGTRLLAPFFGAGLYTWSALISVTLAALSLGYAAGGRVADRRGDMKILFGTCLLAGIWTLMTPLLGTGLLPSLSGFGDPRPGVLLGSLLLFGPNLFLLGAIGPFVIRLINRSNTTIGSSSGLVFSVSTVGSLGGALVTGFLLIPNFGTKSIFSMCAVVLILLAVGGFAAARSRLLVLGLAVLSLLGIDTDGEPPKGVQVVASHPSFYGTLKVVDNRGTRALLVDGIGQNYVRQDNRYNTAYLNFIASVIRAQAEAGDTALLIGTGAGQLPGLLQDSGLKFDAVELDPAVIAVARTHFGLELPQDRIHLGDGRWFLQHARQRWRYIVIDAFSSDNIAAHLLSRESLLAARTKLSPGGILVINVTSRIDSPDVAAIQHTLGVVFRNVRAFSPSASESRLTSIVFVAANHSLDMRMQYKTGGSGQQRIDGNRFLDGELHQDRKGQLITDDFNPLDHYRAGMHQLWFSAMKRYYGDSGMGWLLN